MSWIADRDKEMQQRGRDQRDPEVHELREKNRQLEELIEEYRKEFRGRCPQSLAELTDEDTKKYTPFSTTRKMLIWYKHFVDGRTAVVNGQRVSRSSAVEGFAGYLNRYRKARRKMETIKHPDTFDSYDHLGAHPLRDMKARLNKTRTNLRKKEAVHQYHKFVEPPQVLRSAFQREKFGDNTTTTANNNEYQMPLEEVKQKRVPYNGTRHLNPQQECLILWIKYTQDWPIECLAWRFLGGYNDCTTKVIRNVLITWTAFLYTVLRAEDWWVSPDICARVRPNRSQNFLWDYIGDCTCARSFGMPRNRDANTWLYGAYYHSTGGKFCVVIVPNGGIVAVSTTFGAGTGDRKIMEHMGVCDRQAYRRLTCTCESLQQTSDTCEACKQLAVFAYDAAVTDAVVADFRDVKVDVVVSGLRKANKDDKLETGTRSLAQFVSSERIRVEDVIGIVKSKFKIIGPTCKLPSWWIAQVHKIVFLCCMFHNFGNPCIRV